MFRDANLKVAFAFTIISSIAATTLKRVKEQSKERTSFDILFLKVNLELNLFLILKITFK